MIFLAFAIIFVAVWGFGARSPHVPHHWSIHLLVLLAAACLAGFLRTLRRVRPERGMAPHHQRKESCLLRDDDRAS